MNHPDAVKWAGVVEGLDEELRLAEEPDSNVEVEPTR